MRTLERPAAPAIAASDLKGDTEPARRPDPPHREMLTPVPPLALEREENNELPGAGCFHLLP